MCRSAIFELIVIGPLQIERRGTGGKIGRNHVGDDGARLGEIESNERRVHGDLSKILASSQEFRIDRANLVESFAQLAEVVDQFGNLHMSIVGHLVPARTPARLADGQIMLRSMSWPVDAVAVWSTATLVGLDQCATHDIFDRRQGAYEPATAFA
jgi:hypothetical protein